VDHDSLLVHLLSILAVATMFFICGCTLSVVLFAAHYLYMYESMMRDLQIKNFKTWEIYLFYFAAMYESLFLLQCICNVFHVMYLQHSKTGRYLLLVPQAIPVFNPWQAEQQMNEAGNSYRQGIVTGQGMSDRHISTHSWAGKNLLRY